MYTKMYKMLSESYSYILHKRLAAFLCLESRFVSCASCNNIFINLFIYLFIPLNNYLFYYHQCINKIVK